MAAFRASRDRVSAGGAGPPPAAPAAERCPECGAPARSRTCEELFQEVLALDHSRRPPWGPLHGVTVSCYLLQHPGVPPTGRGRPWEIVCAYLDGGTAAAARLTERSRRGNSHRNPGRGAAAAPRGAPPEGTPPTAFAVTIADVAGGGFPADGFADRVTAWAEATVDAWKGRGPVPR